MTSSALRPNRTVRATIKGKTEKLGTKGTYLSVQILRDGMRFPESFNCWDTKQLEYTKLNEVVSLILHCDGKKADKEDDGQDNSYWWSIAGVGDAPATTLAAPRPPGPAAAQQHAGTGTPLERETGASTPATHQEQQARGYDLGMAFNKAVDIVIAEASRTQEAIAPSEITTQEIRRWRDRLLHEVILVPAAPPHWCYKHEVQNVQSPRTKVWGHKLADGLIEGNVTACTEEA